MSDNDRDAKGDREANRLAGRIKRYAKVGTGMGGVAARMAGQRVLGREADRSKDAADLALALGGLKGPLMKVAQLLATIPDAIPPEYTEQLMKLQTQAPPMGWAFVRRRMAAELGPDWLSKFADFEREAAASASLGQVHRATGHEGRQLACKLQYPDMESAVEADLSQLQLIFAMHRRMGAAIDTREIATEIGARLREELDYEREARHMRLYRVMLAGNDLIRVPDVADQLSTRRLLTMDWLHGRPILEFRSETQEVRNLLARAMFQAWWHPFSHFGVIHGDPHLGNYTVFAEDQGEGEGQGEGKSEEPGGINLLDYGCIRIFPPSFVQGVIDLYHGLQRDDRELIVHAYETWGFKGLNHELIDILNIWARFIYEPLLEDRVRAIGGDASPTEYGRREAFKVHKALKEKGPVTVPREFVFMDRAAIGLGAVFLHLRAELNFFQLFNTEIAAFDVARLGARQDDALSEVGLVRPD